MEALSALAAFLMILLFLLTSSSTALAASVPLDLGQKEALDRAGVSVVRLLVSYTAQGAAEPDVQCTGLGVLVASWPSPTGNAAPNNWLLADGNLINPNNSATCLPPNAPKKLIPTVEIFYSNAYTAGTTVVPSNPIPISSESVHCQNASCKDSLALLSFRTDPPFPQPYMDLATGEQQQGDGLALTNASGQISFSPVNTKPEAAQFYKKGIAQLLTPNLVSADQVNESWLPLVNSHGQLVGVQSSNATGNPLRTSIDIQNFLNSVDELKAHPANPLHESWKSGIDNYYNDRFSNAQQDFQTAFKLNTQFLAAQKMAQLAAAPKPPIGAAPSKNTQPPATGNSLAGWFALWPWFLAAAIVVLVLLLIAIRIMRKRAFEKDLERIAETEAKKIKQQEELQRQEMLKQPEIGRAHV